MSIGLMTAVMWAAISEGHVDLADFLFLIAAIVLVLAAVIEVMASPTDLGKVLVRAALAAVALAWFVL